MIRSIREQDRLRDRYAPGDVTGGNGPFLPPPGTIPAPFPLIVITPTPTPGDHGPIIPTAPVVPTPTYLLTIGGRAILAEIGGGGTELLSVTLG